MKIVDAQGRLVAQYRDEDGRIHDHLSSSGQQSKTIIVNGVLVGKVVTGIHEQHGPSQTVWLFALTAGLFVSAIVCIWMHLMVGRLNRSLSGIAKQAHYMLSKDKKDFQIGLHIPWNTMIG